MNKKKIIIIALLISALALSVIIANYFNRKVSPNKDTTQQQENQNATYNKEFPSSKSEEKDQDSISTNSDEQQEEDKTRNKKNDTAISPEELKVITERLVQKNPFYKVKSIKIDRIYHPSKYEVTIKSVNQGLNHYIKAYLDPKTGVLSKTWGGTRYENRDHMIIPVKK